MLDKPTVFGFPISLWSVIFVVCIVVIAVMLVIFIRDLRNKKAELDTEPEAIMSSAATDRMSRIIQEQNEIQSAPVEPVKVAEKPSTNTADSKAKKQDANKTQSIFSAPADAAVAAPQAQEQDPNKTQSMFSAPADAAVAVAQAQEQDPNKTQSMFSTPTDAAVAAPQVQEQDANKTQSMFGGESADAFSDKTAVM